MDGILSQIIRMKKLRSNFKDREILERLKRSDIIYYLESKGLSRKKLLQQSDDSLLTLYDIQKRKN